ncbi:MAG: glycosyltransferase [bacterium]|nr:glycosyltransferase [bacterium]
MEDYKKYWRWLIMILSVIFSVRYLIWRFRFTLNPNALWFSLLLLIAELHGFIETTLFFFMVWNPTKRKSLPPLQNKTVDILVPTYDEPEHLLRMTLLGCMDLKYPHTTYVLDDGRRPEIKVLAEKLNCVYMSRTERKNAKAGNLNSALKHINGEFLLTLDADHIPLPTLINETIGFFIDEKVALVQMPQDFYNLDSFQHTTNWSKGYSWHEQELFYSVIQPGKDYWNAAFYCGSTTMIRRKAIDEIGGFAEETITEDIHTALRLHAKGWHSVYYNKTMARGIAPSTLGGFAIQRFRWGAGAMQVWKINNPLTTKGLSIPQRLCYFASMYTYFGGFQKLIYLLVPIIILNTGFIPIHSDPSTFLNFFVPYFFVSVYGMSLTMGGFRGIILVEQYNIIKLVNQMKAVIRGIFGKEKYIVTPKQSRMENNLNEVSLQLSISMLSCIAIIKGVIDIFHLGGIQFWAYLASIFWAIFYTILTVPMALSALSKKDFRKLYRFDGKFDINVQYENVGLSEIKKENSGFARNISPYGLSLTTDDPMPAGRVLKLKIFLPDGIYINTLGEIKMSSLFKISKNMNKYMNGIEFKNISESDKDKIIRFLMLVAAPAQAKFLKLSMANRIRD